MSNHTHLVVHVDKQQALCWSMDEVLQRWHRLHKGTLLTQRYLNPRLGPQLDAVQLQAVSDTAEIYRQRLYDLSWFMRQLNEKIAREANKEDQCSGRFWEGRFKSQALLDEAALAACLAYVDLNPIRAKVADTPETSAHTSVKQRIKQAKQAKQPTALYPFVGNPRNNIPKGLPFELKDYLALVELTGCAIRQDKRGYISSSHSPILERLNIDQSSWLSLTTELERQFGRVVGSSTSMLLYKNEHKQQRLHGMGAAKRLLNSA